jgi:putative DNA primase/helicase
LSLTSSNNLPLRARDKHNFLSALLATDLRSIFHIITLKDTEEIFIYNTETGLYEGGGKIGCNTLKEKIKFVLGNSYSDYHAKCVIDNIKATKYTNREDFTSPLKFIPVENGVLNISKNPVELTNNNEKFYFTKKLPATYNPDAKCPKFLKFLSEILPEEKFRLQIQEMFGWCLWRDYNHQVAFMLVGEGSNGRSTLLGVLRLLLGNENVISVPLQELCKSRFATAELYKKFANIAPDISKDKIEDSSGFKTLTGGDLLKAEKKFCNPFYFVNHSKLIFSANKLPYTTDKSYAYYRRWVLIFFRIKFGDDGSPRDIYILEKITTPEEMSGIINWSLEGLQRLNNQGVFSERMSVAETQDYYNKLLSPAYAFIIENITETYNSNDYIPKEYLK